MWITMIIKIPYKCPVCNGNGLVPNGFYMQTTGEWASTSVSPEPCRSCGGNGIVYGSQYSEGKMD